MAAPTFPAEVNLRDQVVTFHSYCQYRRGSSATSSKVTCYGSPTLLRGVFYRLQKGKSSPPLHAPLSMILSYAWE